MSDELLPYYRRELAFLRRMGGEFAKTHPSIAARLRLDADMAEDPHVERMVEAFAYLNARTRHKLDDEFPEISSAMLSVLCPHYLAPIPSMAIVQFALDESQADLTMAQVIDRHSVIETEPVQGASCSFRTCYPVALWPIRLQAAKFQGPPFSIPENRGTSPEPEAVIRLQLQCISAELTFGDLPLQSLRFFLHGQQYVYDLYETIFENVMGVVIASSTDDKSPVVLRKSCLRRVGFGDAEISPETMLDPLARSFTGYSMLAEYFTFPEKFLFFDITGLTSDVLQGVGNQLEIYLLLDRYLEDLERNVGRDTFRLGCAPVINLFRQRAAPITLRHTEHEYRVIPDERRPVAHEVYSVDRVTATSPAGQQLEYRPFYSVEHGWGESAAFWHATRRPSVLGEAAVDHGTEVFLTLVDLEVRTLDESGWLVNVDTTCLNRDVPSTGLPFGGGRPLMQLAGKGTLIEATCLTPPTKTLRPPLGRGALWRLISHLSLNHLSLTDSQQGAEALREILKLYDFADSADTREMISGLLKISHRRVVGRVDDQRGQGFCRGLEVTLHMDEDKFVGSGLFLFGCVLERFLGLYTTINSFTKTIVATQNPDRVFAKWPRRAGNKTLL